MIDTVKHKDAIQFNFTSNFRKLNHAYGQFYIPKGYHTVVSRRDMICLGTWDSIKNPECYPEFVELQLSAELARKKVKLLYCKLKLKFLLVIYLLRFGFLLVNLLLLFQQRVLHVAPAG